MTEPSVEDEVKSRECGLEKHVRELRELKAKKYALITRQVRDHILRTGNTTISFAIKSLPLARLRISEAFKQLRLCGMLPSDRK